MILWTNNFERSKQGSGKSRSWIDQIFIRGKIIEGSLEFQANSAVNFMDFKRALDGTNRKSMWSILRHYGLPDKIVRIR